MFGKKVSQTKDSNNNNIIAEGVNIEGRIYSPRPIQIDGRVVGEIISKKELVIGKEGKVRANIKAKNAIIEGDVTGNIISSGEVRITSTGKMIGNIIQGDISLIIDDGGLFKGKNIIVYNTEIFKINNDKKISGIKIKPKKILEY
ncbi:MAG: polymer-forming cytoskeletal protein [Actinobacteria bacterium]|nr:polymer-forming cytoskeletal protein [Actinomycetota bacterium]